MAAHSGSSSSVNSLQPPCPKSPPEYPDLYGKRRETAKVQVLEREIAILEEEIKTVEGLHPASRYCKEVGDFVLAKSDPLIPINRKNRRPCRLWKWLCGMPCFNFSWISWICCCCYSKCSIHVELPPCCDCSHCGDCNQCCCRPCTHCSCSVPKCWRWYCPCSCPRPRSCNPCTNCSCSIPKCWCWYCPCSCPRPRSQCCRSSDCCILRLPSCPDCFPPYPDCSCCCQWKCSGPKCPKVLLCCGCSKTCRTCNPCCLSF